MSCIKFNFFNENYKKLKEIIELQKLLEFNFKNELKQHKILNRKHSLMNKILNIDYCYHKIKESIKEIIDNERLIRKHSKSVERGMIRIEIPDSKFWDKRQLIYFELNFFLDEFFRMIRLLFRDIVLLLNVFAKNNLKNKFNQDFVKNVKNEFGLELFNLLNNHLSLFWRIRAIRDTIEHDIPSIIKNYVFEGDFEEPKFTFIDINSYFNGFDCNFTGKQIEEEHKRMRQGIRTLYESAYSLKKKKGKTKWKNIEITKIITEIIGELSNFLSELLTYLNKQYGQPK